MWKKELGGHHNALVAKWVYCRVCELIDLANDAGPPTEDKGWHLELVPTGRHPSRSTT